MRLTILNCAVVCLIVFNARLFGQSEPPKRISSPDGKFAVEIVDEALPGTDSLDEFTLIVSANGKTLSKVPTYGYLIAAHWSGDGKHVAINNRRGNSGDYVWVFDLNSGKAVKQPDDRNGEAWQKAAADAVHKEFPSANEDTLIRDWVTAQGWENNLLKVVVRSVYRGAKGAFDLETVVDPANWKIKSSKLVRQSVDDD
ncbi:MAG TPA: hypothetical protein VJ719_01660 [Chthoniobacterales bacterium]|nr:hypothetical protein [Chthoniobacterales bacterium]